jgi:hypothetical protein
MSATTDLVHVLKALPSLTALVGERIYPVTLPQGVTLPAIRYMQIDNPPELSHSGSSELSHPRIQLTAVASTYATAEAIAEALKLALHGSQRWGPGCVSWIASDVDGYEPETGLYMRHVDVLMWR